MNWCHLFPSSGKMRINPVPFKMYLLREQFSKLVVFFLLFCFFWWCIRIKILHRCLWYLQNITTFYTVHSIFIYCKCWLKFARPYFTESKTFVFLYALHATPSIFPIMQNSKSLLPTPHPPPTPKQKGITALICYSSIEFISETVTSDLQLGIWYPKFKARSRFLTVFSVLHHVAVLTSR